MESSPLRSGKTGGKDRSLTIIIVCLSLVSVAVTIALIVQCTYGEGQVPPSGVVSSDCSECSKIGAAILKKGGSAVDAVIAASVCTGVVHPHLTGIGGGGYLMALNRKGPDAGRAIVFSFLEIAEANRSAEHIVGSGVPGFLRGLNLAQLKYGKMKWKQLIDPSVELARNGVLVTESLASALKDESEFAEEVKKVFFRDGEPLSRNQLLVQEELSRTLDYIAKFGAHSFYNGLFSENILLNLQQSGIAYTSDDLRNYEAYEEAPINFTSGGITYFTPDAPSGGPELLSILNILQNYGGDGEDILELHRTNEAVKMARGQFSQIGDPLANSEVPLLVQSMINKEGGRLVAQQIRDDVIGPIFESISDSIRSQIGSVVVAVDGDDNIAISVTSLTSVFGSKVFSSAGFFANNALDNFALPDEPSQQNSTSENHEGPRKRPLSHLTPLIATEGPYACGLKIAIGSTDPGQLAQVLKMYSDRGRNLSASIEAARILPGKDQAVLLVEDNRPGSLTDTAVDRLAQLRYSVRKTTRGFASINGLQLIGDNLVSHADSRGGGFSVRLS